MKYLSRLLLIVIYIISMFYAPVYASESSDKSVRLSAEEMMWLENNKNRTFTLGLTPQAGFEYFSYNEEQDGYMLPLANKISADLGIKINLSVTDNWNEVYTGLQNGSVDILYGANETAERSKFMAFTKPVLKTPYAIISKKDGPVHTIGDLDNRWVGFVRGDFAVDELSKLYKNVNYNRRLFRSLDEGIEALKNGEIDAFIILGGPIVYDYIYRFPELSYAFKIGAITSDMTFSTRKEDKILVDILNKEISYLEDHELPEMLRSSEMKYNFKVIRITEKEQKWLDNDGTAVIGVTKDYLPFDYYEKGQFKGIDASILKEISRMTGIKLKYDYSTFDDLASKLNSGAIDVLNIAKTSEREKYITYTSPLSTERDIIVGRKSEKDVKDIYGLEGKSVAVVKGFWHYDLLRKNLSNVNIIETNSIQASMRLVHEGVADFLIENPSVVRYYTEEFEYFDLVQRGSTSTDSYLYFGISKAKPELASIMNKVLPLMDLEELNRKGYEEVPHHNSSLGYRRLVLMVVGLVILLFIIIMLVIKLFRDLVNEKTEKELLRQREYLLSIDTLTELHNRNYLSTKVIGNLEDLPFPQVLIVADLNDLKLINDNYGHISGDILLKSFAAVLREACPKESQIFRVGGDEFLVILTGSSEKEALETIRKIRETTEAKELVFGQGDKLNMAAALGYSIRYSKEIIFDELIETADSNMYMDKRSIKECQAGRSHFRIGNRNKKEKGGG